MSRRPKVNRLSPKHDILESHAVSSSNGNDRLNELRTLSDEQLGEKLAAHQRWIASNEDEGRRADLSFTDLGGANLKNQNLARAILRGSNLKHADISLARLNGADLESADLSGANLKNAHLGGASLRDAIIQNADFLGTEFAGADMSGSKLSDERRIDAPLKAVEEISKNARNTFFVLLVACVYSWLTIATTIDARLVTDSASTPLPIIGTAIPIVSFYVAAPLVLIGVFIYFHFYLRRLWMALAKLPAIFPDGRTLDERSYPWLVTAIVRRHNKWLSNNQSLMDRIEGFGTILLAWWIVPITLVGFWVRYLPSHEWVGTGLHVGFIVTSVLLAVVFYRSAGQTLRLEASELSDRRRLRNRHNLVLVVCIVIIGVILWLVSYGAISGARADSDLNMADVGMVVPWLFDKAGYDVFADLREIDVSTKPADFWRIKDEQDRVDSVKGAFLKKKDLRYADMFRAFLVKAILRNADLEGARLRKVNLQDADLRGANLQNTDLRGANLKAADLREANLTDADLVGAQLQDANLGIADMIRVDFDEVDFQGADLRCADLTDAKNLSVETLSKVKTLYKATLDPSLLEEIKADSPHLLAPPEDTWVESNARNKCPTNRPLDSEMAPTDQLRSD